MVEAEGEIKTGARNNADDKKRIRSIRAKAKEIVETTVELEPDEEEAEGEQQEPEKSAGQQNGAGQMRYKITRQGDAAKAVGIPAERAAVKALKPWDNYAADELTVLGLPFGGPLAGRDTDGEAFTEKTDIWLRVGDEVPVTYIHGFGPDDPWSWQDIPVVIGMARYDGVGEVEGYAGHVFTVRLDPTEPLAVRVMVAAAAGQPIRASSGAVGHLVRTGAQGYGIIDVWPVGELAVFDTNDWRQPANGYAVVVPAGKAAGTAEAAEPQGDAQAETAEADPEQSEAEAIIEPENKSITDLPVKEDEMTPEEIQKLIDDAVEAKLKAAKDEAPAVKAAPAVKKVTGMGFSDEPKAAFTHWVKTGDTGGIKATMKAALQEASGEGLELTPDDFFPGIIAKRDELSIIRDPGIGAQIYRTNSRVFDIPAEGTSMTKFSIVAEEGAISAAENEPAFSTIACTIYKFRKVIKVSEELMEDDQTGNLEAFLNNAAGRALADTENYYVLIGGGTTAPQGVFVGGTAGLTLDAATAIGITEVPELFYKLPQPYRDNARWVMNGATEGYLRGLTGNQFYFTNESTADNRGFRTMLNVPVINNSNVATKQASAKSMLIGNFAYYAFVERATISVTRLVELYAGTGQIGLSFGVRFGGAVTQAEAFQYATHPTA